MNLFILSLNFKECAEYMFDKHVSKIILEAVQMLCTTMHVIDPENPIFHLDNVKIYKIAHKNHPVTIWMRTSLDNYMWTINLIEAMHDEWKFRYNHPASKMHKSYVLAQYLKLYAPESSKFPQSGITPFALAMPEECKLEDPIESYRKYYQTPEKRRIASWKNRNPPYWWVQNIN
jgi:Pyrimidine dimer DNA glycosylase